ncbi:unnamed protein product [Meloidogyne enterolobii]|uniref:Uncharacterized protein n=1 Tax=Meloidogyne enterolobii TaxID=390850 RepID=A0ACB1B5G1_MELEN
MTDDDGGLQTLLACIWSNFSCPSLPPPLSSHFADKACCVLIQQHYFFFIQCFVCFATKEAASGLHQSGFVSKPVEADVELSSPTSKAQVPFGICVRPLGVLRGF